MPEEKPFPKRYSYSALSTFTTCPMQFWWKYIQRKRADEQTLPLGLGSLLHKGKELVSKALINGESPDYETIEAAMWDGYSGPDKATGEIETLMGLHDLKSEFFSDWVAPDDKSGLSYEQKLDIYFSHIRAEEQNTEWRTIAAEINFEVPFEDVVLFGVIDNISENSRGDLMVKDYKSSKKVYSDADIKTPLQMVIYNLAVQSLYPERTIVANLYDFILLGKTQLAGTPGWMDRGIKKLSKILSEIRAYEESGAWKPKPTPLCHWCSYCRTNPNADLSTKGLCEFYSLWMPQNKTFSTNKPWFGIMPDTSTADFVV